MNTGEKMIENHNQVLNYLLKYKESHDDFTFATRVNNRHDRLSEGYWFLGNEMYMSIPLFKRADDANKTKTIGLVYQSSDSYIELTFRDVRDIDDNELTFYNELISSLPTAERSKENQFRYYFPEHNLLQNMKFYLENFRPKCVDLIKKYKLEEKYIISEDEFQKNIKKITESKKNLLLSQNLLQGAFKKFVNSLKLNNDHLPSVGLNLFTIVEKIPFFVYKNNNKEIFTKPVKGASYSSQEAKKILSVLSGETIGVDEDKVYIEPIVEYIKENYLQGIVTKEDLLKMMVEFQHGIHPDYTPPPNHYFRIQGQEMLYPRKYIVRRARMAKGLDNTNFTTEQAKNTLDNCFITGITHINKEEVLEELENDINVEEKEMDLNTIFYGPPGTGKTYSTTQKALEIIDGKRYSDHSEAKKRFSALQESGQIQMVTFHQSYGYEEFVEGLSADTIKGQVSYKVKNGVFKDIVHEANTLTKEISESIEFDELYDLYLNKLSYPEEEKSSKVLKTVSGIEFELFRNKNSIVVRANNNTSISISKNALLQTMASGKAPYYTSYMPVVLDEVLNGNHVSVEESSKDKKYVLIIDEINRGNISKIFGELITLVEPSKRLGAEDETKIILPYSKDEFSIPANLYIIGTMNTADRSIAVLDTALRRRFDFEEMMPNIGLVKKEVSDISGVDVAGMLDRINKRIEVLYDRDHMIGHAYLLGIKNFEDLQRVMINKIIPLLQEYFYDDWEKINMIFNNNNFIQEKEITSSLFSNVDDAEFDSEQKVYTLDYVALKNLESYVKI